MYVWLLVASLALLLGCSDLECPEGQPRVDGKCQPADPGMVDPPAKTKTMLLACKNYLESDDDGPGESDDDGSDFSLLPWELTVEPGPILSGSQFGATFSATAHFPEYFLNLAQTEVDGGVSRVNVIELQATVHVRGGATNEAGDVPEDVTLKLDPEHPWTCRYDGNGNAAGEEFPSCAPENDKPDDSNDDCTGLGGAPDPENPCGRFVPIEVSDDCELDGACDTLGEQWLGVPSAQDLCDKNGFCVLGPLEVPLEGSLPGYVAADSGHVLFGWDDASTGAELDQTSGANDGIWILPEVTEADFDQPAGPNAMRLIVGDQEIALECTMAVSSWSHFGVGSRDEGASPAPDHTLISFPIQDP